MKKQEKQCYLSFVRSVRAFLTLAGKKYMHKSSVEFVFQPELTPDYGVSCPWTSKNQCFHFNSVAINLILFKLAENQEMHNISDEFKFWTD